MCIYIPSVKLHSWLVVLENSIWSLKSSGKMVAIFCMNPDSCFCNSQFQGNVSFCCISTGAVCREQGEAYNRSNHSTVSNGRYICKFNGILVAIFHAILCCAQVAMSNHTNGTGQWQ